MTDREVYPSAPLRLVTAEYRYPLSPKLTSDGALEQIASAIGDTFPIVEPAVQTLQVSVGTSPGHAAAVSPAGFRFLARDRTASVTMFSTRLAVETTRYEHWEDFRDRLIRPVLQIVGRDVGGIAGIERIGLRYIDEVRVPNEIEGVSDWGQWIASELVAPAEVSGDFPIEGFRGWIEIATGPDAQANLVFGAQEGFQVDDAGPLNLATPKQIGPFFLLDIDSYWRNTGTLDVFDVDSSISISDTLHQPVRQLFEACITDRLRDEVLRRKR